MRICVDAGHGGVDPGAVNGKLYEKVAALNIAKKVGALLKASGHEVIYTRNTDRTLALSERCSIANNAKADYFISIHLNSAGNKSASGIETYAYSKGLEAYKLAQVVQASCVSATGAKNRGAKTADFYVLRRTRMEAILVETGFISNAAESKKLFSASYQDTLAKAIAQAVIKFVS